MIHTVKGFGIVNKAEIDVFLELSCFFDNPVDVGNLISGSSAFSKISLNICKFTVLVLLVWRILSITLLACAAATKSLQLCPTLCDAIDVSPPGFSVPGILQARILEWVAISFSNVCMHAKLLQSCLTLCYPMDSSPPGSSVHGIL